MFRISRLIAVSFLLAFSHAVASPSNAQRIEKAYQTAMEKWALEMRIATTPEEQTKALAARPDAAAFAKQMWENIGLSLNEDWTLEPAAWFLRLTPSLVVTNATGGTAPIFAKENEAIRKAVETHHLKSLKLIPICSALASSPDPHSLTLLEKIQASHTDLKTQGVAALGAAMQLKTLGDSPAIMSKRLNYIRKAIILSAEVEIDGTTVAKIAEDELYIIQHLTKGSVAPDLVGVDSAKRPLSLSAHRGKVILLLFWHSNVVDAQRVVEITTAMEKKYKGRPLAILGVNNDSLEKLRTLQADGLVPWTNFSDPENKLAKEYRVGVWPLVYVLDGERKIHYAGAPGSFAELTVEALLAEVKPAASE